MIFQVGYNRAAFTRSNRTFMELKLVIDEYGERALYSSNRTFMELK